MSNFDDNPEVGTAAMTPIAHDNAAPVSAGCVARARNTPGIPSPSRLANEHADDVLARDGSHRSRARSVARRDFILKAAAGTVITALGGGLYVLADRFGVANAEPRADGRPRVPPGQRVITELKPMGGVAGNPSRGEFRLKVHGEVDNPIDVDFRELLAMDVVEVVADVHCVTGWTMLDAKWKGVRVKELAERAKVRSSARHVVFESAHGYTANVRIADGTADNALVTWEHMEMPLRRPHGAPVRALVPDLYFWKSAKWLTGIKFVRRDEPGYWETRGYHNHADPWKEERYA